MNAMNLSHPDPAALKVVGLLGGMSYQSTMTYYQLINDGVNRLRGGHTCAEIVMYSVNFQTIETCIRHEQWDAAAAYLADKAVRVEHGGADFLLIATNTMHRVAPQIQQAILIPVIHIVDAAAEAIQAQGLRTIGILGTKPTMEAEFYVNRFQERFGITPLVPSEPERADIHRIIFDELCHHIVTAESRQAYLHSMRRLVERGAQGIVLGCTEIGMLVTPAQFPDVPLFDTTVLHTEKAVRLAVGQEALPA